MTRLGRVLAVLAPLTFLAGFDLIWELLWLFRKFAASLASNQGQPECKPILTEYQPILTDPEPGVDQQKESIGDGTVDIDVELYEPVDDSDSDIDMVFALLICALAQKGMGFGHLCHGSGLLLCLAMQGETENKEMNQDESLMDIDSADSGNPLAATEYVEELYKFYRENEVVYRQTMLILFLFGR
jgi:cyclin B